MNDMLRYEREIWNNGFTVCGIDEAGRGPLAGPLVVAGVVFPIGFFDPRINDSKQLSAKRREALFEVITDNAAFFYIDIVEPGIIDELNIYQATKASMTRIAAQLDSDVILTDAMPLDLAKDVRSIIKGDTLSVSIAAASILAKVTRDRLMLAYDKQYPEYGFARNKGYPTREHLAALTVYGLTPIHRRSYGPVAQLDQMRLPI